MKLFWAFSSFEVGGAQRRFASLAKVLGSEFTHVVSAMDGRYDAEEILEPAIGYRRCEVPVAKGSFVSRENVDTFADVLAQENPDLLLTTNWGSIEWRVANRRVKIPHLHCEDGFGPDEATGRRNIKRDLARRFLFSTLATGHENFAFVAPSHGLAEIFQSGWGVPRDRIHLIPNGIDIERFATAERTRAENQIPVVGSVGAFRAEKRFDRLIRVFAALHKDREAGLLLVGDGPERAMLEALVDELGIRADVSFAGAMADVSGAVAQMDVYAITSDTEQMPISLIEAMAAGKPVVGSDVGDVKRMLDPVNTPFVHQANEENAMAASLRMLIDDRASAVKIGKANAKKAEADYSVESMAIRYKNVFEGLVV